MGAPHKIRVRTAYWRERAKTQVRPKAIENILGIDGEGVGRRPHKYSYLAVGDSRGRVWELDSPNKQLPTMACLDLMLSLPQRTMVVGFAFLYDLTKILQDLPNDKLYFLFHEEKRAVIRDSRIVYRPVMWEGYSLNYMNRRFSVSFKNRSCTVWDVFAFFACKFTKALKDWKIAPDDEIDYIERMKDQRGDFENVDWKSVKNYCQRECQLLSQLVTQLIAAHEEVGLTLRNYFGAGSTAKALLHKLGVKEFMAEPPPEMKDAVSRSFFGGRFENSRVGPVEGPVYNADISSAYPYHITFLPCLTHGTWSRVDNPTLSDIEQARLACCRWSIKSLPKKQRGAWGPFPVRSRIGTIAFPLSGVGGWVWRDEYLAGLKMQPLTKCDEAWLYHTTCDCQPFKTLPQWYLERVKWGKESKGIVLKLGPNAVYGATAQSKGLTPPFQSWVWAGNITSGCRGQLLRAISTVQNPWDVLALATDGIWSTVPLTLEIPRDTGTFHVPKPLGGWELKTLHSGVFCVRPGIYFPLEPSESDIEKVRARGVGRKVLYDRWKQVVEAWNEEQTSITFGSVQRFVGVKSGVTSNARNFERSPEYGEWVSHPVDVTFNPWPKRKTISFATCRLQPWIYFDWLSCRYGPATHSPEALALKIAQMMSDEQPDSDMGEMDIVGGM